MWKFTPSGEIWLELLKCIEFEQITLVKESIFYKKWIAETIEGDICVVTIVTTEFGSIFKMGYGPSELAATLDTNGAMYSTERQTFSTKGLIEYMKWKVKEVLDFEN